MNAHVVVEGPFDAELMRRVLDAANAPYRDIRVAGGKSVTVSFAKSMLTYHNQPVALVVDADTSDASSVEEQKRIYGDMLRMSGSRAPFQVCLMVPEMEVVLFGDGAVLGSALGVTLTEQELQIAEFKPKKTLNSLLSRAGKPDRLQMLAAIDEHGYARIAEHPALQPLLAFLHQSATEAMAARP